MIVHLLMLVGDPHFVACRVAALCRTMPPRPCRRALPPHRAALHSGASADHCASTDGGQAAGPVMPSSSCSMRRRRGGVKSLSGGGLFSRAHGRPSCVSFQPSKCSTCDSTPRMPQARAVKGCPRNTTPSAKCSPTSSPAQHTCRRTLQRASVTAAKQLLYHLAGHNTRLCFVSRPLQAVACSIAPTASRWRGRLPCDIWGPRAMLKAPRPAARRGCWITPRRTSGRCMSGCTSSQCSISASTTHFLRV